MALFIPIQVEPGLQGIQTFLLEDTVVCLLVLPDRN